VFGDDVVPADGYLVMGEPAARGEQSSPTLGDPLPGIRRRGV